VKPEQPQEIPNMVTAKLRNLPAGDFDRLADLTNLQEVARAMARQYFVENRSLTEIAHDFSTSKQRVNLAVGVIRRVHEASAEGVSQAWIGLDDSAVPEGIHQPLVEFLSELRKESGSRLSREQAIDQVARALQRATWSLK
jgi:hypothetical protein